MATKPKPSNDDATTTNATNAAVLDPPPEQQTDQRLTDFPLSVGERWLDLAGQEVHYLFDDMGRSRGADVMFWRGEPDRTPSAHYSAAIRWDADTNTFKWWERNNDSGEWELVKRGQNAMRLASVIEQAINQGTTSVLDGFIT